jgi:hypothetical protein
VKKSITCPALNSSVSGQEMTEEKIPDAHDGNHVWNRVMVVLAQMYMWAVHTL